MMTQNFDDLKLGSYDYFLPPELIADRPVTVRHNSRLLVYRHQTGEVAHHKFFALPSMLPSQSLLVLNQSKVYPCRLLGKKKTGAAVEVFFLSLIPDQTTNCYPVLLQSSRKKKLGDEIFAPDDLVIRVEKINTDQTFGVTINIASKDLIGYLQKYGKIPIPPYIRSGESDERDVETYQTTFAKNLGSVAAPTAGLHFTHELFEALKKNGHDSARLTLHVGLGTFLPVKCENILEHKMHNETYHFEQQDIVKISSFEAKRRIAVGTTALRALESSVDETGKLRVAPEQLYQTDIFLHPGKQIHSVGGLITNFHLPKSTLLMLVSTLIGREKCLELYKIAIAEKYRFFSYGDAMLILL